MRKFVHFVLIFISIFFSSCSTETGTDPVDDDQEVNPLKATFSSISDQVFDKRCSCHLGGQTPNLNSSVAFANIVGKKNNAGSKNYIEPGQPDNSYLYQKIISGGSITGSRMPASGAHLTTVELDSIRLWIENGALNN